MIGHQHIQQQFRRLIAEQRLHHAYLFSGPEQIGKSTLTRLLSQQLLCVHGGCNDCQTCHLLSLDHHPDCLVLANQGESIGVEEVRKLIERCQLTFVSPYLVVRIENLERMTTAAQNAFLKTLEEPHPRTVFLCTATDLSAVLPTVLSRMILQECALPTLSELVDYLQSTFPDVSQEERAEYIQLSLGLPGRLIALCHDPELATEYRERHQLVDLFLHGSTSARLQVIQQKFSQMSGDVSDLRLQSRIFLQDLLHLAYLSWQKKVTQQGVDFLFHGSADHAMILFAAIVRALSLLQENVNPRLVLATVALA